MLFNICISDPNKKSQSILVNTTETEMRKEFVKMKKKHTGCLIQILKFDKDKWIGFLRN